VTADARGDRPTLHLLSAGAAKGLVEALRPAFEAERAIAFQCAFGAVGAMREKLLVGEACDVVILTAQMIEALATTGLVTGDSPRALGRVFTGVAVPSSRSTFDSSSPDALRAALVAATAIYLPDPERATAGIHFANVLRKLGIHDEVRARLRPYPNGALAMRAMADASAAGENGLIGCTQVTEIKYTEGVALVGLLPKVFELATTYTAAACSRASQPAHAEAFVEALSGDASAGLRRAGGFVLD
jgi:molybdate transport system substrate-binding protein